MGGIRSRHLQAFFLHTVLTTRKHAANSADAALRIFGCPIGGRCIRAIKSQYGLVQAAHNWEKLLVKILTDPIGLAMIQLDSDPCVFVKRAEDGSLLLILGSVLTFSLRRSRRR